ncbi:MAG: hypothetical protein ACRBEE_13375 [Arenicella sp.]
MNSDLIHAIDLLTKSRVDIYNSVKCEDENAKYFGRDSEDEGHSIVEVALLELMQQIFRRAQEQKSDITQEILELRNIIDYALDLHDCGMPVFFLRTENSYDLFWDILKRYAESVMSKLDMNLEPNDQGFDFETLFEEYGFSIEKGSKTEV